MGAGLITLLHLLTHEVFTSVCGDIEVSGKQEVLRISIKPRMFISS